MGESRVTIADIVSDKREPQQDRIVQVGVASEGVNKVHGGSHASAIDADVLVIIVVAAVTVAQLGIEGYNSNVLAVDRVLVWAFCGGHMARTPRTHSYGDNIKINTLHNPRTIKRYSENLTEIDLILGGWE